MPGIMIALVAGAVTPVDIGVGGAFYMEADSPRTKRYGAEAEFLAHLIQDQLYLRTGILYFIRDEFGDYSIGLGSGLGWFWFFGGGSVDALYYFVKQKPNKYKMSPYILGGFYFTSLDGWNLYGVKAGAGISYPLGKKSPMRLFGEAGTLLDVFSISDYGSELHVTIFGRGGIRFNVLN